MVAIRKALTKTMRNKENNMKINFDENTLTRRYTYVDLTSYSSADVPLLNKKKIEEQNKMCGFDYENKSYPIKRKVSFDSVVFSQGRGPVRVAEPIVVEEEV